MENNRTDPSALRYPRDPTEGSPPSAPCWWSRHFWPFILAALVVKVMIGWLVPLTGDEAYFYIWGMHPALGYYDHPPMVGWWMTLILHVGRHPLLLRALAIMATMLPAVGLYIGLRARDEHQARRVGLVALFLPLFMIGVLITTDTPMFIFGLFAIFFCQHGLSKKNKLAFLASGIFLGLAFLGKYFAALIGIAFIVHFLFFARKMWFGLVLIIIGALPAIGLNLYWNWNHSWYNVMFNLVNRHDDRGLQWENLPLYIVMMIYLIMPWVLWQLIRHRVRVWEGLRQSQQNLWITTSAAPLGLLLMLAPMARIGLHWVIVFLPGILLACYYLPVNALVRCVRYSAIFCGLHVLLLALALALPLNLLEEHRRYGDIVFYLRPWLISEFFQDYPDDTLLFSRGYSGSAVLSYYTGRYFGVLGTGSRYGRQDDIITDFRIYDGADMVYLMRPREREPDRLFPFFEEVTIREVHTKGVTFRLLEGKGFRYPVYRDTVLMDVFDRYYQRPTWLPEGRCLFSKRYFPDSLQQ